MKCNELHPTEPVTTHPVYPLCCQYLRENLASTRLITLLPVCRGRGKVDIAIPPFL
jgi:hypothetical protein